MQFQLWLSLSSLCAPRSLAALARGRVPSVRSPRSLGVASPPSARCARSGSRPLCPLAALASGYRPYGAPRARRPSAKPRARFARHALLSVRPDAASLAAHGVVAAARLRQSPVGGGRRRVGKGVRPRMSGWCLEEKIRGSSPSICRVPDLICGRCLPRPMGMEE